MRIGRLWGIRHVRWAYGVLCFGIWWERVGQHLGAVPNPADLDYLDAVWEGRA